MEVAMPASTSKKTLQMSGTIHHLDLVSRELELLVRMRRTSVDIPPDCLVLLRGEPVKLRLLQPGDFIHVAFDVRAGAMVAREIEVHGNQPPSPTSN
jgi:hypothetical protein